MKKIICLMALGVIVFASCDPKKEGTTGRETPKGNGYTLDSSANIELAKKINAAFLQGILWLLMPVTTTQPKYMTICVQ